MKISYLIINSSALSAGDGEQTPTNLVKVSPKTDFEDVRLNFTFILNVFGGGGVRCMQSFCSYNRKNSHYIQFTIIQLGTWL